MGRLFAHVPADGVAHWAIYKVAEHDAEYPWFVEHRLVNEGHPRREHDEHEFEYGSWATFEDARDAMVAFSTGGCLLSDGSRLTCPTVGQVDDPTCEAAGQHVRSARHTRWECAHVTEVDTDG